MLIDARPLPDRARLDTEVCVIGTGPAGAVVAAELAARGVDVLVVEGGGGRYDATGQDTYRGTTSAGHDPLDTVRQKRLGGTSEVWGGRCAPLDDDDLASWPLTGAELAPHLLRAQQHLQAGEYAYTATAAGLPEVPAAPDPDPGLDVEHLWRWSPPTQFGARVQSLARAQNVRLLHNATVVRLDRDPVGGAVTAAVVVPRPGVEVRVVARTYVLAAGGLESTRILLASDQQTPAGLGNEHDQVGRHYATHPVGEVGAVVPTAAGRRAGLGYERARDGVWVRRMLALSPAARAHHGLGNLKAALWFADPLDPDHGDGLLSTFTLTYWAAHRARLGFKATGTHARYADTTGVSRHAANVLRDWRRVAGFTAGWARPRITGDRVLPSFMPLDRGALRLRFDAEQRLEATNRVTLSGDRDALGQRRLHVAHRVSTEDRDSIRRSLELIGAGLAARGLAEVELGDLDRIGTDPFGDGTHQMGLLRMGATPRVGVVDQDARVFGAENLYVAGSAVFPTGGAVGPTLLLVALAVRVAQRVADHHRGAITAPVTRLAG